MKYGINNPGEETAFERKDVSEEKTTSESEASATMAKQAADVDAVIFSIQFYGKTVGEVGMMDQDLSELDWKKFKSYLFQNLLTINHQENICVSYSDEEGDKLPIDSDAEYQEALKVAKKKAEMHDKLVLDITRQGGLPTMLSLVSSGIKKVSTSPPKEGGISFFKASSPPKEGGFKSVGERKLFQGFFMPDKGPIPGHVQGMWGYDCDEAQECGKVNTSTTTTTTSTTTPVSTARTYCKRGPPIRALRSSSPNMLFNFESPPSHNNNHGLTSACQDVFGAGIERSTGARPKSLHVQGDWSEQPPEWFTSYMGKFRAEVCEEVSERIISRVKDILKENNGLPASEQVESLGHKLPRYVKLDKVNFEDWRDQAPRKTCLLKKSPIVTKPDSIAAAEEEEKKEPEVNVDVNFDQCDNKGKKKEEKAPAVKRKKFIKEEERLLKKQEKIERKKLILTTKYADEMDNASRLCRYADEMDKASRTQEKVFAKMEGLRKKQFCSQEELSKLRKMVDKQQRFITAEQRQQRRNERKAGYPRLGKSKKISIDNKGYPVDASLLHAALQELEALAEDSTSDGAGGATTRGYDALYLKDITYPDGSIVFPGKEFVKTWRVVNNGVVPWNEKTTLCKWSQVRFRGSPSGWKLKPSMKRVVCPPLEPGKEGDISITFTAPSEPGWYATHWRFCQRGRVFGNQMWCAIHVEEEPCNPGGPQPQLGKPVVDENGVTKRLFSSQDMQELKAAMSPQPVVEMYPAKSQDAPPPLIAPPREELVLQNDLGIVENYYDAEDPVQRDLTEGVEKLTLSCSNEPDPEPCEQKERDLISFEEDAELLDSGTSTPEMLPNLSQAHAVISLKEMAKESVESLITKEQELKWQLQQTDDSSEFVQPDTISVSSGSFSELDSEDQAILNESDSDGSDHEYYVVHLPDCFNSSSVDDDLSKESESSPPVNIQGWREEVERLESPDFLTADEDDRTTAVASDSSDDLTCPLNEHNYASRSSSASQASSSRTFENGKHQTQFQKSSSVARSIEEGEEDGRESKAPSTLPTPPVAKPFMSIPNEAIKTNILLPNNSNKPANQTHKDQDPDTWTTGACNMRSVVCEQPSSAQLKESKETSLSHEGVPPTVGNESTANSKQAPQLPVDLGALPDELVSIIPEDLVRGAWNTARSFLTRINQEMLSPTADSPGRVYGCEESTNDLPHATPPEPPVVPETQPQQEEAAPERDSTSAVREAPSPLAPPMQQLEDMGFHNREVNQRLLTKYNGDVSCAVAELIILDCH